jgi:integrase
MVGLRRKVKWIPTSQELENICQGVEDRTAFIITFLYLSGRRVSEVLQLKRKDIYLSNNILSFNTFNEKSWSMIKSGPYTISLPSRPNLFYENIEVEFNLNSDIGKLFAPFILDHLKTLEPENYIISHLLTKQEHLSRSMISKLLLKAHPDLWPHLLRHTRFTHSAIILHDDPIALNSFTHHRRFANTLVYIHRADIKKQIMKL